MVNTAGEGSYPIVGLTYLLVYDDLAYLQDPAAAQGVVRFLTWALTEGQDHAAELHYTALPDEIRQEALEVVAGIKAGEAR